MCEKTLENAFHVLSKEVQELYMSKQVPELHESVSPLEFYRSYVSRNMPVVIRGGVKHWKAVKDWSIAYLKQKIGDQLVNVTVTPNGYADAVAKERTLSGFSEKEYFVMPEERYMRMNDFLEKLENPCNDSVYYIQRQNSNFQESEFHELWRDVDSELSWAFEAFGSKPDAINFWMGDHRAVTSMHKDPYENIYCVISGEKEFILHPPTDQPWIPYKKYPSASYKEVEEGKWITETTSTNEDTLEADENSDNDERSDLIPWIAVDPLNPDYEKYPKYKNATKIVVKVNQGDILYLPSLWFHHVRQSHSCIAVNYWYDMDYDIKYAYYKFIETLCK